LHDGREKAEQILSEFPKRWLGIREGWKSIGALGSQLTRPGAKGSLDSLKSNADLLRAIQVSSVEQSSDFNQLIGYQFAFESWLANAKRAAGGDDDQKNIQELEELQRQIREQYSEIWKSFDKQRSELALLSQMLFQNYQAMQTEIANRTSRNLGVIGIVFGVLGALNIAVQWYLLARGA
jgi:Mg2+ and Co2+ transporter CorA